MLRIIPPGVKRYDINGSLLPDGEEHIDVMCCGDDMVGCRRKWKAFKMCVGWYLDSINLAGDRAQKA